MTENCSNKYLEKEFNNLKTKKQIKIICFEGDSKKFVPNKEEIYFFFDFSDDQNKVDSMEDLYLITYAENFYFYFIKTNPLEVFN